MASQTELGQVISGPFTVGLKRWRESSTILMVLGIIVVALAIIIAIADEGVSKPLTIVGGLGVFLCALAIALAVLRKARRSIVTLHEDGCVVVQNSAKSICAFSEIAAIGHTTKNHFANGKPSGRSRCIRLWRKGDPLKRPFLEIVSYCKTVDLADEQLDVLVGMIVDRVADRMEEVIAGGGTAKGGGVQLRGDTLVVGNDTVPLDDIVATGFHRDKMCIWRREDDHPSVRLDPNEPNVLPIVQVLTRRVEQSRDEQDQGDGLGRILFERRTSRPIAWVVLVAGILTIWLLGLGLLLILLAINLFKSSFRAHERGVHKKSWFKDRTVRYTDVESFTCSTTRMYYNGVYTGTTVSMKFVPGDGAKPLKFNRTIRNMDSDLDNLRDHISAIVARKMLVRYATEGQIEWTPDTIITGEGLHFRPKKLIGKGNWQDLPFDQIAGSTIEEGTLSLFALGQDKPVLRLPVSTDNFFPGAVALGHLLTEESEEEFAPDGQPTP